MVRIRALDLAPHFATRSRLSLFKSFQKSSFLLTLDVTILNPVLAFPIFIDGRIFKSMTI